MWVCKPTTYLLTEHNKIEVEKMKTRKGEIFYILVIYCGREIGEKKLYLYPQNVKLFYQFPELQNVEHFKVTSGLTSTKLGYIFPEAIDT